MAKEEERVKGEKVKSETIMQMGSFCIVHRIPDYVYGQGPHIHFQAVTLLTYYFYS